MGEEENFIELYMSYLEERRLNDVQWTLNRLLDEIERSEIYQCELCNRTFRSLYQRDQHQHSQIHRKQFQCQFANCHKTFVYMRNLRQHQKNNHENPVRLQCPIENCSKTYTTQSSIDRHVNTYHLQTARVQRAVYPGVLRRRHHRTLMNKLLLDSHPIVMSDESFSLEQTENTNTLLKGYEELGLVKLF